MWWMTWQAWVYNGVDDVTSTVTLRRFPGYLKRRSPILKNMRSNRHMYHCMAKLMVYLLKVST